MQTQRGRTQFASRSKVISRQSQLLPETRRAKLTFFGLQPKTGSRFGSKGIRMLPGLKSIREGYLAPRLHHALALQEGIEPQEDGGGGVLRVCGVGG